MTPRLESCFFASAGSDGRWFRLSRALERTARQHCPSWRVRVEPFSPTAIVHSNGVPGFIANTQKLEHWESIIAGAADGERILLIDVDTVILRPLDDVWDRTFDVAYTVANRFPINGGVVFVRVSDRSKAFMAAWVAKNRELLVDYEPRWWRAKFGGINQAAFCLLTEGGYQGAELLGLPCAEWNCEDSTWAKFDPAVTRILHVKSHLRQACLSPFQCEPWMKPLRQLWRDAERAARSA